MGHDKSWDYTPAQKRLLRLVYSNPGITRQGLVAQSGLSTLTVTKAISDFIKRGILVETEDMISTGGRKAHTICFCQNYAHVVCADIGASATRIALVSIGGEIIKQDVYEYYDGGFPTTAIPPEQFRSLLKEMYENNRNYNILGVSICISGLVDSENGRVIFCPNIHGYDGMALVHYLQEVFDIPVILDTSARTMALAEQYYGTGKGIDNQIFISVGFSISAGIILNGRLFKGTNGFAGEIGHIHIASGNEEICTCGNRGCLEVHASLPAILNRIQNATRTPYVYSIFKEICHDPSNPSIAEIQLALSRGDKLLYDVFSHVGDELGKVATDLANVLNPDRIILGGGAIEFFPMLVEEVSRTVKSKTLIPNQQGLTICKSSLGFGSALMGSPIQIMEFYLR